MTFADQLDQLLVDSREHLSAELHADMSAKDSVARAYARTLWSLEDAVRELAALVREGAPE